MINAISPQNYYLHASKIDLNQQVNSAAVCGSCVTHNTQDTISISNQAQQFLNIDKLETQVNAMFFEPKELNSEQLKQEQAIFDKIDKLLGISDNGLTKENQLLADKINKQIDKIFSDDQVTAEEEKQLTALGERLDKLYPPITENPLTPEQEKELNSLFGQLDKLYGIKTPTKEELLAAEKLYQQLDIAQQQVHPTKADIYAF